MYYKKIPCIFLQGNFLKKIMEKVPGLKPTF